MTFVVTVHDVSGDASHTCRTSSSAEALEWLCRYDHEGSCVSLTITVDDEAVYTVLDSLIGTS